MVCLWCRISILSSFPGSQALCTAAPHFGPETSLTFRCRTPFLYPPTQPFSASHHPIFFILPNSHAKHPFPSSFEQNWKISTYFTIVNAPSPLSAPRLWIKLCADSFSAEIFPNRAVCKTSNKMEICNFFQICSSFSHLPTHSGAKIWTSDEISRIKIHQNARVGFFPRSGDDIKWGWIWILILGNATLSSMPTPSKPNVLNGRPPPHQRRSSFHRKVGIFQSDSYCRPPLCSARWS